VEELRAAAETKDQQLQELKLANSELKKEVTQQKQQELVQTECQNNLCSEKYKQLRETMLEEIAYKEQQHCEEV